MAAVAVMVAKAVIAAGAAVAVATSATEEMAAPNAAAAEEVTAGTEGTAILMVPTIFGMAAVAEVCLATAEELTQTERQSHTQPLATAVEEEATPMVETGLSSFSIKLRGCNHEICDF